MGRSGKKLCKGEIHTDIPCTLSRVVEDGPMQISGPCTRCRERRCKTHCRCGRSNNASGRSAGRPAEKVIQEKALPIQTPPVIVPPPIGRKSKLDVQVFRDAGKFLDSLVDELESASSFHAASYVLDDLSLCHALLRKLQRPSSQFTCNITVDHDIFHKDTSRYSRARLRELQRHGASVSLAKGFSGVSLYGACAFDGAMHVKAVILSHRVAYTGGSNLTKASRVNRELSFRMTGEPVAEIFAAVLAAEQAAESTRV